MAKKKTKTVASAPALDIPGIEATVMPREGGTVRRLSRGLPAEDSRGKLTLTIGRTTYIASDAATLAAVKGELLSIAEACRHAMGAATRAAGLCLALGLGDAAARDVLAENGCGMRGDSMLVRLDG